MTREQEFRKQTEEAKFEAFSVMCEKVNELEKENAELKEEMKAKQVVLNDFKSRVETVTDRFNKKSSQLTEAKEIITKLVEGIRIISHPKMCMSDVDVFVSEAEQFLKDNK